MTDDLGKMRGRQDKLEARVAVLEVTVKEEAGLRAKMDSDLGDMKATLNAHGRSLQALHDTQSDHTRRLTRIEDKVGTIEGRLGTIEGRVGTIEGRVGTIEGRVGTIEGRVGTIAEQLADVRVGVHAILDLLDTHLVRRPKWASLARMLRRKVPRDGIQPGN
jgi:chromosome segregation ATPase